ncbi:MAG: phosphate acyltransferase PlsX [Clostridia bacterium]
MKIVVDAFGGDNAPREIVGGVITAVNLHDDIEVVLTGDKTKIEFELKHFGYTGNKIEICNASEVITNDDIPTLAIKNKKGSSLVVALDMLKNNDDIVGLVSAGSTGAVLAGGLLRIGRLEGVIRPALSPILPTINNGKTLLIDCGANVDSKASYLVQFAVMGSSYMKVMYNMKNPRVALLSNGTEDKKGNELNHEAFELLKETKSINFIGNMEARDILSGNYDVIVTDGFAGNIGLKASEGAIQFVLKQIKTEIYGGGIRSKLGALLLKPVFNKLKSKLDYSQHGGSPFLGIKKLIIKSHGSSKASSIYESIIQIKKLSEGKLIDGIKSGLGDKNA